MKICLMTLNMFGPKYFRYLHDHDFDSLLSFYREMMKLVRKAGYRAVDVTSMENSIISPEKVKEILAENELVVSSYIYMDTFAAMDANGIEERIENAKRAVDLTKDLGADVLMLVPQAQEDIMSYEPEKIRKQIVKHWIPVVYYAKEKKIHVVAEDTPDLKLNLCRKDELKEVLGAVPGLELVYDSGNMLLVGEDPVEYYDAFADVTAHIHLKDMEIAGIDEFPADTSLEGIRMKTAPTGKGFVDFKEIIGRIKANEYEGYLTIEFACESDGDYEKSLIRSRNYVEKLIDECNV